MRPSGSNLNLDVNSFQDSKPIPQVRPSNNAPSAVRKAVEISKGSEGGITSINQKPSQFTSDRITDDVLSKDVDRSLEIRENGAERMGMDIDLDSGLDFIDPSRLVGGNMMMENQDLDGSRMVDDRQGRRFRRRRHSFISTFGFKLYLSTSTSSQFSSDAKLKL